MTGGRKTEQSDIRLRSHPVQRLRARRLCRAAKPALLAGCESRGDRCSPTSGRFAGRDSGARCVVGKRLPKRNVCFAASRRRYRSRFPVRLNQRKGCSAVEQDANPSSAVLELAGNRHGFGKTGIGPPAFRFPAGLLRVEDSAGRCRLSQKASLAWTRWAWGERWAAPPAKRHRYPVPASFPANGDFPDHLYRFPFLGRGCDDRGKVGKSCGLDNGPVPAVARCVLGV